MVPIHCTQEFSVRSSSVRFSCYFEKDEKMCRVLVELPQPAFSKLEKMALQRRRTVSHLVEEVITGLVDAFVLPEEKT